MTESSLKHAKQDPRAFGEFYREHATAVTRYFMRRIANAEASLDLAAETFAEAYVGRRRFRGVTEEEARAWLYVIARRQLAAYLRRGYAARETLSRLGLERPEVDAEELQRVEGLGEMDDVHDLLTRRMSDLPDGYREAVRLRVVEELPYVEVAQRLDITETAARMRVSRALARLRTGLLPKASPEGTR
jgi:RNA polymerase sigma-70 factor (ECF subfamily)